MKTRVISYSLILTIISFLFLQLACNKEPETIGLDLLDENKLGVYDTTFSINAYSIIDDSILSDELSASLLGSLQTEDFGLTNASFYSHLRLSTSSPDFGDDPQPDSAILSLVYAQYYGFINTPLTVKVYEVIEDFYRDSSYYSTSNFEIESLSELANHTFVPNPTDSILQEDSTYINADLRIPLNETFINKMLFPTDDSVYSSSDNFIEYFKGLYVAVDSMSNSGEGSILYFDLLNPRSNVTLYYGDSLSFEYSINSNCATVGKYQHNYSKSLNQNLIQQITQGDTTLGSESLYLQGLGGIETRLNLSSLEEWVGTNKYAINEAKIVIPVIEPLDELPPASQLILFQYEEDGSLGFIRDQLEGDNYFGGKYNSASLSYQFRVSLYVQSMLNGTPGYGLVMYTSGKSINANQVSLYGTAPDNPISPKMYLNVIYTLLE